MEKASPEGPGTGAFPVHTLLRITSKKGRDRVMPNTARKLQRETPPPAGDSTSTALSEMSDEELVTAHLEGRPSAFQELFGRYRDRLVHFITRKTGDPDRAQDLVQEAFIRVTRHLHRFDTEKKFSTWVYTIASNLSKNELRNRSRSPLVLFQKLTSNWDDDHRPLQFEDLTMRPDDLYRKRFLQRLVEDTVEELPEHHRLVFRLRELEGKSYEEISEITGVNLGTVKSRLHRARNSFAQRIEHLLN
jgi:RNA polymerase sigma-70 factor, ECF subfamily